MVIESAGMAEEAVALTDVERGVLTLLSSSTRAEITPLGAATLSLVNRASGVEFLMRTPWADEDWTNDHPSPSTSETWHRRYPGGWHTLIPHAGEGREAGGVSHPFHGEAAWRQWRLESADEASCRLSIMLRTAPLAVTRSVTLEDRTLAVEQTVTNVSRRAVSLTWTEHPALSETLIGPRTAVHLDGRHLDLRFPASERRGAEFRTEPSGAGVASVHNPDNGAFAHIEWDPGVFPYAHVWQEHRTEGFPWWGLVSALAIEPASREYWPHDDEVGPLVIPPLGYLTTRVALTVGFDES